MSVGFALAVAEGLRFNSVLVSFQPGWETSGNGQSFPNGKPEGLLTHHTGGPYGGGLDVLIHGRPDLSPPLCNCCTFPDGRIHIIAAHPANHAGASGGPSMGPLPTTNVFNRITWGNEVMFPGTTPWTPQQYRSARVLAGVISGILRRPNPEWCRFHSETSRSGKWDVGAGRGPGIPFDGNVFRAQIWDALTSPAPTSKRLGVLDMPVGVIPAGKQVTKLVMPIGSASGLVAKGWLSLASSDDAPNGHLWIQGAKGGLAEHDVILKKDKRWWVELPDGTDQMTVHTNSPGSVGWCLELQAK